MPRTCPTDAEIVGQKIAKREFLVDGGSLNLI
jgi:hypothetical protein